MTNEEMEKLLFEQMLYKKEDISFREILEFDKLNGKFRRFCPFCKNISTFYKKGWDPNEEETIMALTELEIMYLENGVEENFINIDLKCIHNPEHKLHFYYIYNEKNTTKIGQYPSFEELREKKEIEQFREVLGEEKFKELVVAIGLNDSKLAIPAFTYLRRIVEDIIIKAKNNAISDKDFNIDTFNKARIDEKINLLKKHLPNSLFEKKII